MYESEIVFFCCVLLWRHVYYFYVKCVTDKKFIKEFRRNAFMFLSEFFPRWCWHDNLKTPEPNLYFRSSKMATVDHLIFGHPKWPFYDKFSKK